MRDEPADLTPEQISSALRRHWGIDAVEVRYAPVGHGGYHWTARERTGTRWFVTADARTGEEFERVRAAYESAATLRGQGLDFIHTPTPDLSGDLWRRISPSWAMAVSTYVEGRRPDFQTEERARVAELVGRLHAFSPAPTTTPRWELPQLAAPVRRLLDTLDTPWSEGPFGEPARALLIRSAGGIEALLGHFEHLSDRLAASDEPWVITHGEPHAGDVLLDTGGDLHLIDWDDTRIAPRERDLRILLHGHHNVPIGWDNQAVVAAYQRTAGPFQPRSFVLDLFRADWCLGAVLGAWSLRQPHRDTADTAARWHDLHHYLPVEQNWPNLR